MLEEKRVGKRNQFEMTHNHFYYIDALRSSLMLGGIIYHAALIYMPDRELYVIPNESDILLGGIAKFLHIFRMPAFFLISGFFSAMLLEKYGRIKFIWKRLCRIGLPLVSTALLINTWVNILRMDRHYITGWYHLFQFEYWLRGEWIVHLWFLNDLLVLCALCVVWDKGKDALCSKQKKLFTLWNHFVGLPTPVVATMLVVCLPLFNIVLVRLAAKIPIQSPILFGIIDLESVLKHAPFFFFGYVLWHSRDLLRTFQSPWYACFSLLVSFPVLAIHLQPTFRYESRVDEYAENMAAWGLIAMSLWLFKRYADYYSAIWCYLARASYSVYLVHMLFIVGSGSVLVSTTLSPYMVFVCIVIITTIGSFSLHHFFIQRYQVASFMFNGVRPLKA